MRMSDQEKDARKKQKAEEWRRELAELEKRRLRGHDPSPRAVKRTEMAEKQLCLVHDKMRSVEFKAWYEATTGSPVDDFLDDVVIPFHEWISRGLRRLGMTQIDWTRLMVELVAARHPWTDPEKRVFWAGYLDECEDARERRTILQKLATPVWADRGKMLVVYAERDRLTRETGIEHHVDHIVPIVHPEVCGLHCELNLRVIPATENRAKSNMFNGLCHYPGSFVNRLTNTPW